MKSNSKKRVILKKLHLRNFLSFGNKWTILDLNISGNNLILGENRDVGEEGSRNGVGKTTILQAISVALFNQPITKIKVNHLINATNKKSMEIKLEFCTEWNSNEYMIHVGQKKDFVHLYDITDGNKDIAADSKVEVVKQIEELIGINNKMARYVMLFSATSESFLEQSAPKQREIIESLFDMDIITKKAEGVAELKKEFKKELDYEQYRLKIATDNNERSLSLIAKTTKELSEWDRKTSNDIAELEDALHSIGNIDQKTLESEISLVDDIMSLSSKIKDSAHEISKNQKDINAAKKSIETTNSMISKIISDITHLEDDNCPFCKQSMPNANVKLKACKDDLLKKQKIYDKETLVHVKLKKTYDKQTKSKQKLVDEQDKLSDSRIYDNLEEIRSLVAEKDTIEKTIVEFNAMTNPHSQHLINLKENILIDIDSTKEQAAQSNYTHADFLLKLLNNKNSFIRQHIIGNIIPMMNNRLTYYINRLGLPHTVMFGNDLTVSISQYSQELSFGNLSTGERQRINLALSFSFRDILSSMYVEFNCLFLDEVLDCGLDEVGVFNTVDVLNDMIREKDMCVYLISHRKEVSNIVDRIIHVIKDGGFSRIEQGF